MEIISSLCEVLASEAQPLEDGPTERASDVKAGDVMCHQHINCMPALPFNICECLPRPLWWKSPGLLTFFFEKVDSSFLFFLMFLYVHSKIPLIKYKIRKISFLCRVITNAYLNVGLKIMESFLWNYVPMVIEAILCLKGFLQIIKCRKPQRKAWGHLWDLQLC